ncbi:DUF4232 domain-containing protein [Qaidamihabitans albus]|uniref:DUF4232 domain-containing protein n=1 Tax=Qaidamihabitans albus TaxID=2795733 RepID=UPI001F33C05C|nr:DUF4232 domain-containing protein [Qaidamihabitans albus]
MTIMRGRVPHVALGAVLMLVLASCGQDTDSAGNAENAAQPDTTTSAPSSTAATADDPPATTGTAPATNGRAPADPALCRSADLQLALGRGSGAAGTHYRPLRFTNTSDAPCVVQGFPGVSYVAGDDGHQVGPAAKRVGEKGSPVTLQPGETAHAVVGFVQVRNYDPAECRPTNVRGIRVYPPQETESIYVKAAGTGCASDDIPGDQLTVKTIQPGAGGR